jgi:hypothetical protein
MMGHVIRALRLGRAARGWIPGLVAAFLIIGVPAAIVVGTLLYQRSGVTETSLQPQAVRLLPAGNDPRSVTVGVMWLKDGWCVGEFRAQATETASEVRLGSVIDRQYSHAACAGVGTVHNMAWADLTLKAPLGNRLVVRSSDGVTLPVLTADEAVP